MDGEASADGTMLMDAPKYKSTEELVQIVHRGGWWDKYVPWYVNSNLHTLMQ